MPLPKIIPVLADLTQDIAGPVPVRLLQDWAAGKQDLSAARLLLAAFEIEGTVVASDTSGLSLLTREMDLLDVLSLISQPKQVLHALGREIGGRAIGTWVADNTEMFYPSALGMDTLVDAMAEAQFRILARLPIKIGLGIHPGRFYEIGGGLYGKDADVVEVLAEQFAGPGEILMTQQAVARLQTIAPSELARREPRPGSSAGEPNYQLLSHRRMPSLREVDTAYPQPYPLEFHELMSGLSTAKNVDELKEMIYLKWLRTRVVVFLNRQRDQPEAESLSTLLDDLVITALMDTVIREVMHVDDHIVSSGGGLAILTFERARDAVDFARAAQARFVENGLPVQIGIDAGEILFFQNSEGSSGTAGDPVNVASKLAEDVGKAGRITITERALRGLETVPAGEHFESVISGITLRGLVLS